MRSIKVLHHANCLDGMTAAWVVWLAHSRRAALYPVSYGAPPPKIDTGATVYIVDFSYSRQELLEMAKTAKAVTVLDHHKTAQAALSDWPDKPFNLEIVFDVNRSGAQIAWDHMFSPATRPYLVDTVGDRDLWKFERGDTRALTAFLYSRPQEIEAWHRYAKGFKDRSTRSLYTQLGEALLEQRDKLANEMVAAGVRYMSLAGVKGIPCVNAPNSISSEVGELLLSLFPAAPCAASYYDAPEGLRYSLRSQDNRVDVGELARKLGGGGHRNAAGFTMPHYSLTRA